MARRTTVLKPRKNLSRTRLRELQSRGLATTMRVPAPYKRRSKRSTKWKKAPAYRTTPVYELTGPEPKKRKKRRKRSRSEAAKLGWRRRRRKSTTTTRRSKSGRRITRRRRKNPARRRKNPARRRRNPSKSRKRSLAAKKGWRTRRAKGRGRYGYVYKPRKRRRRRRNPPKMTPVRILKGVGAGFGAFFASNILTNVVQAQVAKMTTAIPKPVVDYGVPVGLAALTHFWARKKFKLKPEIANGILIGLAASALARPFLVGLMMKVPGLDKIVGKIDTLGGGGPLGTGRYLSTLYDEAGMGRYLEWSGMKGVGDFYAAPAGVGRYLNEPPGLRPADSMPGRIAPHGGVAGYLEQGAGGDFFAAPAGVGDFYAAPAGVGELDQQVSEAVGLSRSELAAEGLRPEGNKLVLMAPSAARAFVSAGRGEIVQPSVTKPGAVVVRTSQPGTVPVGAQLHANEVTGAVGGAPPINVESPFQSPYHVSA